MYTDSADQERSSNEYRRQALVGPIYALGRQNEQRVAWNSNGTGLVALLRFDCGL
jgi:hypothetical protein